VFLYQDRVIATNLTDTNTADNSGSGCQLESSAKNSDDFVEGMSQMLLYQYFNGLVKQ